MTSHNFSGGDIMSFGTVGVSESVLKIVQIHLGPAMMILSAVVQISSGTLHLPSSKHRQSGFIHLLSQKHLSKSSYFWLPLLLPLRSRAFSVRVGRSCMLPHPLPRLRFDAEAGSKISNNFPVVKVGSN